MHKIFLIISIPLLLMSCGVKKRHYVRGCYINWNTRNSYVHAEKKSEDQVVSLDDSKGTVVAVKDEYPLTASYGNEILPLPESKSKLVSAIDSCDLIELRSKTVIHAKVLEINPDNVRYKNCGDATGPDRIIYKSDITSITFSNGLKETYEKILSQPAPKTEEYLPTPDSGNKKPKPEGHEYKLVKHALIAGICSYIPFVGWIFAFLAIAFGSISLYHINNEPGKYSGEKTATIGLYLGIGGLVLGAIAVLLGLFALGLI